MRLAHKRKVQNKLQKRINGLKINLAQTEAKQPVATKKTASVEPVKTATPAPSASDVSLTPKQKQVFDIVVKNAEGINPKSIGLAAGQDEAKAASWATGALKKLLEENLVEKVQLSGNKVLYKAR